MERDDRDRKSAFEICESKAVVKFEDKHIELKDPNPRMKREKSDFGWWKMRKNA